MKIDPNTPQHLLALAKKSVTNTRTRTIASCRNEADGLTKFVILYDNPIAKKLGLTRIITRFTKEGKIIEMYADFRVPSSCVEPSNIVEHILNGNFTLCGNLQQMKTTFNYFHNAVGEGCNTLTAWRGIKKLIEIGLLPKNDKFAKEIKPF